MLKTFKETIASLQDKTYGSTIIKLNLKQAVWYWSKYFILVTAVSTLMIIGVVTYFSPQVPRLLQKYLPDATFTVKDGIFSTSLVQPAVLGPGDLPIIIDTNASNSSSLDNKNAGILLLSDKIIFKQDDSIQEQSISKIPNFSFEKNSIVSWFSGKQTKIWFATITAILFITLLTSVLFWTGRMVGFLAWSLGLWLLAKFSKRNISYPQALNLVLYASVLPYLMGSFLVLAPNQLLSLLSVVVFVYFAVSWLVNLPKKG